MLNVVAFAFFSSQNVTGFQRLLFIVMAGMFFLFGLYCIFGKPKMKREYIIFYLLAALLWTMEIHFWPVGVVMILLMILNILAEVDTSVIISGKGIELRNYRSKNISWQEVDNVIMKDGLLSIDQKNNKIFQAEPDFTKPFVVRPDNTGSMNRVDWTVGEDYPELARSFNNFAKQKIAAET